MDSYYVYVFGWLADGINAINHWMNDITFLGVSFWMVCVTLTVIWVVCRLTLSRVVGARSDSLADSRKAFYDSGTRANNARYYSSAEQYKFYRNKNRRK